VPSILQRKAIGVTEGLIRVAVGIEGERLLETNEELRLNEKN